MASPPENCRQAPGWHYRLLTDQRAQHPINSKASLSYEQVANALQVSVGSVKTLIHRLRKQYTCLLREEVGRTVSNPAEVDGEIHALCDALIATEGRLGP